MILQRKGRDEVERKDRNLQVHSLKVPTNNKTAERVAYSFVEQGKVGAKMAV